jgi:malate dehydrogenase
MEEKSTKKAKHSQSPLRVLITGAAGQIGYSLIPLVASGAVFGEDQPIILHLLDIPFMEKALKGVVMEIEDCAYPLVIEIVATVDVTTAFKGVNVAILLGGVPRKPGMERAELFQKNSPIFVEQGKALNHADKNCKVLVVANPANTNCLIAAMNSNLPKQNFTCLTRLDQNRTVGLVAGKVGVTPGAVKNLIIWGNHSSTQYPDASQAYFTQDGSKNAVTTKLDNKYLQTEFVSTIQQRGAKILEVRGLSSSMSAAKAIRDHLKDWLYGTPEGEFVSMGVWSDGAYDIEKGLMFSFPVSCSPGGQYTIVKGFQWSAEARASIKKTETELIGERGLVEKPSS